MVKERRSFSSTVSCKNSFFHCLESCRCKAILILATIFPVPAGPLTPWEQDLARVRCTFMLSSCLKHHVSLGLRTSQVRTLCSIACSLGMSWKIGLSSSAKCIPVKLGQCKTTLLEVLGILFVKCQRGFVLLHQLLNGDIEFKHSQDLFCESLWRNSYRKPKAPAVALPGFVPG